MSLLAVSGLVKRFGGLLASDDIHLVVEPGELHAVIGPNGAGKTTLINQLSGELSPDAGAIAFEGREITALPTHARALAGIARSYQITSVFPEFNGQQNVMLAAQAHAGHSFRFWQRAGEEPKLVAAARTALQQVGLLHRATVPVAALAHGERRQLEIAMTLAMQPRLLLLDEPMAGMSQHEAEAMIALLHSLKGRYGIVLVEHDMDAVFALADRISVLVYGRVIACDRPAAIRANADVREAYLGDEFEAA